MITTEIPQLVHILANFGFPIAITIYLFARFEKKLEKLDETITELGSIIKNSQKG